MKEVTMRTSWTTSLLIAMLVGAPTAWVDSVKGGADPATKTLPAKASDNARAHVFGASAGGQGGGADPAAKTLPAKASDNARTHAFGASAGGQGGGADPAAKTLPAKASDNARANAFGANAG